MTFSVVGRSDDGAMYGVAVASKFLAVGAVVPAARAGAGALATQALANLRYRPDGVERLAAGRSAAEVVDTLVAADADRDHRQLGVVDAGGGSASYTGAQCLAWAGHRTGPGYAIQGNILAGAEVVDRMAQAWLDGQALPLSRRLLATLQAGDSAGGDSRGRQSAALYVVTPGGGYGGGSDVLHDLRVDDHADPVPELSRLLDVHDLLFGRSDPALCPPLYGQLATEVRTLLHAVGRDGPDLEDELAAWAGRENLEERLVPGRIDPLVLDQLRRLAGAATPPR